MRDFIKVGILSLFFFAPVLMATPCPGPQCLPPIWQMTDANPPSYDNHGQRWIACNPANDIQFGNQTLIVKYSHTPGGLENTCYARYDLSRYFQQSDFRSHGYITATITITGTQDKDFLQRHLWPAFWVRGVGAWPVNGEIDMFEYMADVQNFVTHVNLHGGSGVDVPKPAVLAYKTALEDIGQTHIYGMEWNKDSSGGYKLTFYIDNQSQGTYYVSPGSGSLTDAAIIRGFNTGMQLVFDADDIGSNKAPSVGGVKNLPELDYQLQISNVAVYQYTH